MVETALMILVVLLLLMGIIQFGFIFYAYVRVSNATREGARAGSLWLMRGEPSLCATVAGGVWSEFADVEVSDITLGIDDTTITVEGNPTDPVDPVRCNPDEPVSLEEGQPITVTVAYDFDLPVVTALPIIRDIIPSPFPVSRSVVMRVQ